MGIVGVRQEFHLHWNTEEAVCQERGGNEEAWQPRSACRRARSHDPGRKWFPQNEEISGNSVKDHRWHLVPRVDCVGHAVRVMTERNPNATLFSIDGVGAYDHVLRSAMMAKVLMVPAFHLLLPFGPFIPNVPDVCGKTKRGTFMEFANTKGANRGTLSCPSSASPSRNCLRSWMTCALCRTLTRHLYHLVGEQLWSVAGIGIRMEGVFGAHRESRCWERQSGCSSSSRKLGNVISRFCSAVDPDATIF